MEPDRPYGYWPVGAPPRLTLNGLTTVYEEAGFERCTTGEPEPGYEKIAIYTDRRGLPLHAARQLDNGKWSSKMGEYIDIEHDTPEVLEGPKYGQPARYLRRPLGAG